MRQILFFLIGTLLLAHTTRAEEGVRRRIVCSTTQTADFARRVVGDRWQVECVLAPGQDPHLYQVTMADSKLIAGADLCIHNGWHLEGKDWMFTLARDVNKPLVTAVEGIVPLDVGEGGEKMKDPHAWFSPKNAVVYVRNIEKAVSQIDSAHSSEYEARAKLYLNQLRVLDAWIRAQVNAIPANRRILVTSHDAFNYFCREYGFQTQSPVGWSTGAEIGAGLTPQRRRQTVESIRNFGVKAIFVETSVNPQLIEQIAKEAGVVVGGELYSDSMGKRGSAGESYIGMMRENVLKIAQALK